MKKIFLLLLISCAAVTTVFSQEFYRRDHRYVDTATFMIWASPTFSMQAPFGKGYLASTFNFNYNVGLDLTMKTRSNWTIDLTFNYMFGSKIRKRPEEILGDMAFYPISDTLPAVIFNGAGNNAVVLAYEGRYWYFGATVGKIFAFNRWENSGFWLKLSAGYFGHKIHFTDPENWFPQIDQEKYRLGYDQRSSGIALNQFFGYMFMQRRRVLSFYAGIELWQIFSKPNRGYIFVGDYAGPTADLPRKFSGLVGVKVGWILPFYEKKRVTTFYTF
ncbi:MAG: hypothetical protein FWC34_03290 [Bacteroidetes bacterium]|nr:hypothetical protein [Bacteroidota bacterium]MCL2303662.1 hypothetical protein [Lentimicrobiaceae bacterium]